MTILLADLRDSSELCDALPTSDVFRLLGQVMECLSDAVMNEQGVIIDYYGDGISAMWNAPLSQPDHAEAACRAALDMIDRLPRIGGPWMQRLKRPLRIGVGIHTGRAQVGNVGSRRRIKYGPRGTTVNLASRVEQATKALKIPIVVTGKTAALLSPEIPTFRLCGARLAGIDETISLHAICRPNVLPRLAADIARYQEALEAVECDRLDEARGLLRRTGSDNELVPFQFLAHSVQAAIDRQRGRRASDLLPADAMGRIEILTRAVESY